jgi:hypothetical protein
MSKYVECIVTFLDLLTEHCAYLFPRSTGASIDIPSVGGTDSEG